LFFVADIPSVSVVVIRAQQAEKARTFALLKSVLAEEQKRRAAERYRTSACLLVACPIDFVPKKHLPRHATCDYVMSCCCALGTADGFQN
jgi:hypothetical protein